MREDFARGMSEVGRTLARDHARDLDDGVLVRLGEDTLATSALDVERQDPERRDVGPLPLGRVRDERLVAATGPVSATSRVWNSSHALALNLVLAVRDLVPLRPERILAGRELDPVHADNLRNGVSLASLLAGSPRRTWWSIMNLSV